MAAERPTKSRGAGRSALWLLAVLLVEIVGAPNVRAQKISAQMTNGSTSTRLPSVAFAVSCAPAHQASDDPIVLPGRPGASHRHQFFGNPTTSAGSTLATMLRAGSTTCDDADDLASYWAPVPNGARWTRLRAYYDAGPLDPATITVPPAGLMMIAGDHHATSPQGTDVIAWSCGRAVDTVGWSPRPPRCAAGTRLRARITFPQCWTGVLSPGVADVVPARPEGCPPGHLVALPRLRIVLDASGPVTSLSSGSLDGLHADFWNTWAGARLQSLVVRCIRGERRSNHELRDCRPRAGEPLPS